MTFDIKKIRHETAACSSILHFNNAGASLMPQPVYKVMCDYLALEQSMGGYEAAAKSVNAIDSFYTTFADLLNATSDEIAFCENATRAWDIAVNSISFEAGDRVFVHQTEYSSNYLGLLRLSQSKGIKIDIMPTDAVGAIDFKTLNESVTTRTKAVFLTHVPSQTGVINPVNAIGEFARKHGLIYVLDACQSVGQMPVDVKAIGCDILCGTGRKFLRGPRGTGFLYVKKSILNDMHPPFVDLHAAEWTSTHGYTLQDNAKRFEGWERFMAGQIALAEAARYAMNIGLDVIQDRIALLADDLRANLRHIDEITLRDTGENKSGIVTFEIEGRDAADVVLLLRAQNINVSAARVEHARLDLEKRGISTLVRASIHYFNTEEEIEKFYTVIRNLQES